ncbi:phage integrase N-terminal SAM-like domain-containing protein [Billgrantia sp. C5P2]|uniref:phage integrase N-terminal SAM-like domain-containing protein n=1 Tax=Billgrantia sp. C5P2 TaxID=3436239 RepID=UPI003DA53108
MDWVKATMRVKRYSPRNEKTYCCWICYFICFHGVRHPSSMGSAEVRASWSTLRLNAMWQPPRRATR